MNFNFAQEVNPLLEKQDFAGAFAIAESNLSKVDETAFYSIVGKSLLSQSKSVAEWVDGFYNDSTKEITVAALYFEFTEFDINQDIWEIDGFAYDQDLGLEDLDWFSDTKKVAAPFTVEGYEKIQDAFSDYQDLNEVSNELEFARDWCEQLVIIRFAELMTNAHHIAKQKGFVWAKIPIYFTEHAYDFVMKSIN